jgi:hypothetical protein
VAGFRQQLPNGLLRGVVLSLTKVMPPNASHRVDEMVRGPELVIEGSQIA